MRLEVIRSVENSNDLIVVRTRDLLPFSIVPQPTTLPHSPDRYIAIERYENLFVSRYDDISSKMACIHGEYVGTAVMHVGGC
jgi:hypothetical protein